VEKVGGDGLRITGDLTVHGVTRPVVLNGKVNRIGDNPMVKSPSAGFEADATLRRSEFDVGKLVPAVSDEIKVHITLDSHLAKS
jgi:polyisoprenoid-binding protein YceI